MTETDRPNSEDAKVLSPHFGTSEDEPAILIVDDNYALLEVLHEHLEEWGYHPASTTKGSEAKALLAQRSFHVLLADLRMSPVSGWEVIEEAKKREGTEVIVMTGYASLDSSLEAFRHRAYDFLPKPIDYDRLQRALRNAIQQSRLTRRNVELLRTYSKDSSELQEQIRYLEQQLQDRALRDDSTGLFNQKYFLENLQREVNRSLRYDHPLSCCLLSLDRVESALDAFGPEGVTETTCQVATLLSQNTRTSDSVCRYRDTDFGLILPETSKGDVEAHLGRVRESVKNQHIPAGESGILTLSLGLATCPADGKTRDDLLRAAQHALQTARLRGGDCLVLA